MKKIAIIIPAYNEEKAILGVIEELHKLLENIYFILDIIVINDCSTDNTAKLIAKSNCIDLHLPINLGIGGAVQTGFKYAYEKGYDFAIQIDGDGQHPPHEIPKLLAVAQEKQADVVIGSRFIDKKGFQSSAARRLGIQYFMWLNYFLIGKKIKDTTSGLRLINRKVLKVVYDYYPDEYPEPESIILYALHGFSIAEIAVTMRERQGGVSSINTFSAIYYMLKVSLSILYTYIRIKFQHTK